MTGGTTPQFEIPTDMRKMTQQSLEQVKTAINAYFQFFKSNVPDNVMGGSALSDKILSYAERNVASAFEFAQRLAQVKNVQDIFMLQTEFMRAQMQARAWSLAGILGCVGGRPRSRPPMQFQNTDVPVSAPIQA